MKPKKPERSDTDDLLRTRLESIVDLEHPLVRLHPAPAQAPLGHRARDRSHEGGWTARAQLPRQPARLTDDWFSWDLALKADGRPP
jgi:hypothetical protein